MSTNRGQSTAAGAPRCPDGWNTSAQNSQECFPVCPAGYTFKNPGTGVQANGRVDPNPSCVFDGDPKFYVTTPNVNINSTPQQFASARGLFDGRIATMNMFGIGIQRRLDAAKQALVEAESSRAVDPAGYQRARNSYFTLKFGDTWLNEERQRIQNTEVNPAISNYRTQIQNLQTRLSSQDQYSDIVRNTSESVLSAKNNFQYVVNKFSEQLDKINVETQRKKMEAKDRDLSFMSSIENVLNWIIVVLLIVAVGAVGYRIYLRYSSTFEKPTTFELNV